MGKFAVIPQNAFDALQIDAGVLLKNFDPSNPVKPKDEDIICATSGGVNATCVPTFSDFGEDVDNVPVNLLEFKHLDSWECKFSATCLGTSPELIKLTLGAADIDSSDPSKVKPRRDVLRSDFSSLWWVGDKANGGCVAIQLKNALSTGGFGLQSGKNAKGQVTLEITGHVSINAQDEVPMVFYSIDVDSFANVVVAPEAGATTFPWTSYTPSDMQTGITVSDNAITGTLHYLEDFTPSGYLAGDGYYIALKFSGLDPDATSVKVGLDPSQQSGLVEIINDPDKNGVFKITNKDTQVFKVVSSDGVSSHTQVFDLSGLTLEGGV